ncbi:unnamed protein product [Auanema sp. JU1783]|nr:unnamed protein product [Auanema sp. JU1783]
MDDEANRVVMNLSSDRIPPLPCLMANAGRHEHGETFTKDNFHYECRNGTAEVVACIADDQSVIQLGRVFEKNGLRHKCTILGETVSYEQESMCYENGISYNIGESFRNGSFKLVCGREGISVEGCYMQNTFDNFLMSGETRIVGQHRHECQRMSDGRVRYTVKVIGCTHQNQHFNIGQIWTESHIRYKCQDDGTLNVLGCVDDLMYVDLGRDMLINGFVHRCYQVDNTAFYHKFACPDGNSLQDCIAANPAMARARRLRRV